MVPTHCAVVEDEPDTEPLDQSGARVAAFQEAIDEERRRPTTATPLPAPAPAYGVSTERMARAHQLGIQWMAFVDNSGPKPGLAPPLPGGQRLNNNKVYVVLRGGSRDDYDGPTLHGQRLTSVTLRGAEHYISIGYFDRTRAAIGEDLIDANAVWHGFASAVEAAGFLAGAGHATWVDLRRRAVPRVELVRTAP
jgi:hypothetical protein